MSELDGRQVKALKLLCDGATFSEVARELKIDATTLWRWRHRDPAFANALKMASERGVEEALERLRARVTAVADVLADIALDIDAPHAARVAAARDILDRLGAGVHQKGDQAPGVDLSDADIRQKLIAAIRQDPTLIEEAQRQEH